MTFLGTSYNNTRTRSQTYQPVLDTIRGGIRLHIQKLQRKLELRRQQRIDRDAFANLLNLNDELLNDIGVERADVEWAMQLPLDRSASAELKKLSDK